MKEKKVMENQPHWGYQEQIVPDQTECILQ